MEDIKASIQDLIQNYQRADKKQSEADVRANFIDVLFSYLGWDVWGKDPNHATRYQREGYIRGAGYVDVGLEISGKPVLMLEAKRFNSLLPSNQRAYDRTHEEKQLFRYAHRSKNITYCILTNFERLHVFNADHERLILAFDEPSEYLTRLPDLLRLSPNNIQANSLYSFERELERLDIDVQFLTYLQEWRMTLANSIYHDNSKNPVLYSDGNFDFAKLMSAVQRILDRLILIRYADDKEVLLTYDVVENILTDCHKKGKYAKPDELNLELVDFSHRMDDHHNTTIFEPGHICEQVLVRNPALEKIMTDMNNISFRKFTADIIGSTYESYLSTKLTLKNGEIKSKVRLDMLQSGGIYYTPSNIVHFIVDQILSSLVDQLERSLGLDSIDKVKEITILDPACGSGSFLIYCYNVLANYYRRMNKRIEEEQAKILSSTSTYTMFQDPFHGLPRPIVDYPHHILKNQLYGIDIDPEAAEIASVNLTMQAFAETTKEKLPLILNENIKCCNSLLSYTNKDLSENAKLQTDINLINLDSIFPNVKNGFTMVVGNPPYGADLTPDEKSYLKDKYNFVSDFETAQYFIALAEHVLKPGGYLGFIVPNTLFLNLYADKFRKFVCKNFVVKSVSDLSNLRVFEKATIRTVIPLLIKGSDQNNEVTFKKYIQDLSNEEVYKVVSQEQLELNDSLWTTESSDLRSESILKKMKSHTTNLANILEVTQGLIPYDKYRGHDEQTIKNRIWHSNFQKDHTYRKELRGADVIRYQVQWNGKRWISYGPWLAAPRKKEFFTQPRLLFREITDPKSGLLHVAYTEDEYYNNPSIINCIANKQPYSLKYILGICNSSLMAYYHYHTSPKARKGIFPKIIVNDVRNLPIRTIDFNNDIDKAKYDSLVSLVEKMIELKTTLNLFLNVSDKVKSIMDDMDNVNSSIDEMVFDLYHLTKDEKRYVLASLKHTY